MHYMDRLAGNTRTNAPVMDRYTVTDRRSARNASIIERRKQDDERPSADFLAARSVMAQRYGMCG